MDRSTAVFFLVMMVVAGVSVGAIFLVGSLIDTEEVYDITYVLDGGVNSPDNPSTYVYGDRIELCDPTKEGYLFDGWYILDEMGGAKRILRIDPLMYGDITIYATWSINLVGKTMTYEVVGEEYDTWNHPLLVSPTVNVYNITGTYSLSYLSYDEVLGYNVNYSYVFDYVPTGTGDSFRSTDSVTYWTGEEDDSNGTWSGPVEGQVEYDGSFVNCDIYTYMEYDGTYPNQLVEQQDQYIVDDWIVCRIDILAFIGSDMSTKRYRVMTYSLVDISTDLEGKSFDIVAYGDVGISVSGSGTYDAFKSVTLTATLSPGTEFVGWYSDSGRLLSSSLTYKIVSVSGDMTIYAVNSDSRDVVLQSSDPDVYTKSYGIQDSEWTLISDDTGDEVVTYNGEQFTYDFDTAGIYTLRCLSVVDGVIVGNYLTVFVDGPVERTFVWKDNSGDNHQYTLTIVYSDYLVYLEDDIARTQGSDQHDLQYVTYGDQYIVRIAQDFNTRYASESDAKKLDILLTFTQYIPYQYDSEYKGQEEYWKYPVETLFEQGGDCEDTSLLFCAIAKAMGYDTAILLFDGHMAAGISYDGQPSGKGFLASNGVTYLYCETTAKTYSVGVEPSGLYHRKTIPVVGV